MFEPEFLTMMPHTVAIAPFTGSDFHGEPVFGADVSYRCRITGKSLGLRRDDTEQVTVIFDIYINAGDATITVRDRLTLPNDPAFIDRYPEIFAVGRATDEDGHHHVKLQCGWTYHRQGQ